MQFNVFNLLILTSTAIASMPRMRHMSATNIRATNTNPTGGRWAKLGQPTILAPGHEQGLLINQPLVGFRHLNKEDSFALCPSNQECAAIPLNFFRNAIEFKESACSLSEAGVQAINHEKYDAETGVTTPLVELCREMYSLANCIDSKGAKTDREYLVNKEYVTGVQCLRQQEEPYGCQCVPFSTPELTSHREKLLDFMMVEDGTRVKRPAEFPLDQFTSDKNKETSATGIDGTGGETGSTGGATGMNDPFQIVEDKVKGVESA